MVLGTCSDPPGFSCVPRPCFRIPSFAFLSKLDSFASVFPGRKFFPNPCHFSPVCSSPARLASPYMQRIAWIGFMKLGIRCAWLHLCETQIAQFQGSLMICVTVLLLHVPLPKQTGGVMLGRAATCLGSAVSRGHTPGHCGTSANCRLSKSFSWTVKVLLLDFERGSGSANEFRCRGLFTFFKPFATCISSTLHCAICLI